MNRQNIDLHWQLIADHSRSAVPIHRTFEAYR
jgi:hypothetical protein